MADSLDNTYQRLCEHARQTMLLTTIDAIIGWDERCLMPPDGGEYRAEQMTLLAGMIHDRQTDPRIGEWLDELDEGRLTKDIDSDSAVNIRQLRRQYDKKTKLPKTLVEELARTSVLGQQVWQEARKKDDFKLLQPLLEKTFHLKRQQADALGYTGVRYDALLDDYEQGETTAEVTRVLAGLREQMVPMVAEVSHSSKRPDSSHLE